MSTFAETLAIAAAMSCVLSACPSSSTSKDAGKAKPDAGVGDDAGTYCPADSPVFRVPMEAVGDKMRITARLISAKPEPPERYFNDWTVELVDSSGNPVEDVELTQVQTYMTVHRHGVLAKQITKLGDPARFEVKDVDMFMRGPWEIRFTVTSASAGDDYIVFNHCLDY
jgi:hypothetical protein